MDNINEQIKNLQGPLAEELGKMRLENKLLSREIDQI
jgi:hypothetical protein